MIAYKKISGNMILPPIPGHRKPISGEAETVLLGFSIGSKGYIGTGFDSNNTFYQRFLGIYSR